MTPGDVLLVEMDQADGATKKRPVVFLCTVPPFADLLVCGLSSQLQQEAPGFDELILPDDPDFAGSGLRLASLIRLGFIAVYPASRFKGRLGRIAKGRHARLLSRLASHLQEAMKSV